MNKLLSAAAAMLVAMSQNVAAADTDAVQFSVARGQHILAEARAACGGVLWDKVAGWHEKGRISIPGQRDGSYEAWVAITRLAVTMRNEANGIVTSHAGFDGSTYWRVLASGGVESGSAPSRLQIARRDAYLSNFGYLMPDRYPAAVTDLGPRTMAGIAYDVVHVTPADAGGFDLWIDRTSHRVSRIVAGGQVSELRDYRNVSGLCAATLAVQSDGDASHTSTIHVDSVDTAMVPASTFSAPR